MATVVDTLITLNQQFDAAFNSKNAQAIAALYAADAIVMPAPAGTVVKGRQGVADFFGGLIQAGVIEHALTMKEAIVTDTLATQTGSWAAAMVGEDGVKQQFGGNVQVVFQKQADGQWLAVTHIWN
ncbi:nuclear transport factor 2 family protein [Methylophilus sp. 5]|uniref:YybH family protein n=1 Tax=Methylophilus sp. 5 TaxID=1112274 RepID=UPI00048F3DCD|nr:nuclear transport factor 2 family protein [Methylophilus sp. 5]